MYCKNCDKFDKEHFDMTEEAICIEADQVIRLRKGQGKPDWCPLKPKDSREEQKDGEQDAVN